MDFTADIRAMMVDFGSAATVGGVGVTGIFDAAYSDELGIAGTGPALRVPTADVPAVAQGTAVAIGAASYTVSSVEPDGTGVTLLRLQEA